MSVACTVTTIKLAAFRLPALEKGIGQVSNSSIEIRNRRDLPAYCRSLLTFCIDTLGSFWGIWLHWGVGWENFRYWGNSQRGEHVIQVPVKEDKISYKCPKGNTQKLLTSSGPSPQSYPPSQQHLLGQIFLSLFYVALFLHGWPVIWPFSAPTPTSGHSSPFSFLRFLTDPGLLSNLNRRETKRFVRKCSSTVLRKRNQYRMTSPP